MGLRSLEVPSYAPSVPCLPQRASKLTSSGQFAGDRVLNSSRAEHSGRLHGRATQVSAQLFSTPIFDPRKLTTTFLPGASGTEPQPPAPRRYTLTHNDITGQLNLSIGCNYNMAQVSGWYTRLIRDEVLAEWRFASNGCATLHVYCHVSGEERWLAPPALRNYIFQREMPLVLDTILHADRELFQHLPSLADAAVVVHLSSHLTDLNMSMEWGTLAERASWPASTATLLQMLWKSLASRSQPASAAEVQQLASLSDSITEQLAQSRTDVLSPSNGFGEARMASLSNTVTEQLEQASTDVLFPSNLSRERQRLSPESLLIGVDAQSSVRDSLPQRLESTASATADSVHYGKTSPLAAEGAAAHDPAQKGSAAASLYLPQAELRPVQQADSPSPEASCGSSSREEASNGSKAHTERRGQRNTKQSAVRPSRSSRAGVILPEGNILEFDHGGIERRPGAMQVVTASSCVSEWLASGHEVISVRL